MILILKKDKILLMVLILLLSITVYNLKYSLDSKATEPTNAKSLKRTVIIDPGHGGEDPGAVGDNIQLKEKDINLIIGKRLKELLMEDGFNVIMTREEDGLLYKEGTKGYTNKRRQDLLNRKKIMDESEADIVVSIHMNKFPQSQYHGAQTFFPKNSEESKRLAQCIQRSLRDMVDPENKREALVKDTETLILKNIKKPTVIVECGFLSNAEEEQKLSTQEYQEKLAAAIKEGIKKYYGEE
ncbi:MAG TPA: N-acetylmuramoyl-L-alanine amidase CwlD [Ruminiclostridium sp.]|jgi:N-acetylmuramoyl-L-alanine amidase|uniref:Germination-specific N-acetylmuramoyl-L-alanine amidase n=1 Tax=Acetivibrio saccincola TaxID=1677857 RepID=A0A2K9EP98_9FIRM|nr:N-acetylmuramoyl-L-alanine amidase CwlD [Acetivibrio saccincola]HAA43244.1 N-acetylmuramoyl-L-alanine amidase CwlD [Ruminiclostridium sp.]AUG58451.1 Germination-specific N-acetylmuramoyl-L-alanine amidase precursor [Acetivibrio saccincola]NLW25904.1 N-acetylmuramoyl-L-alanine amidase CwlD [Acetivibrio saccincola]PQQ66348.1 N-acetylmuramoyl-L-alanine amidase CwlD [Acetivibrio saccincola]HOA96170.1 N-acetylmuramoyl-L-alanine amidase CwlD [Acetivibrio saccincola]